jgi:hypothetical protein
MLILMIGSFGPGMSCIGVQLHCASDAWAAETIAKRAAALTLVENLTNTRGYSINAVSTSPQRDDRSGPLGGRFVSLPQPHPGLIAIGELHAGGLKRGADGGEIVDRRHSAALLKVPDRTLAEISADAQFGLRPVHETACGARLFGRDRHRLSSTINDFR